MTAIADQELLTLARCTNLASDKRDTVTEDYKVMLVAYVSRARAAQKTWAWIAGHLFTSDVAVRRFYDRNSKSVTVEDLRRVEKVYGVELYMGGEADAARD